MDLWIPDKARRVPKFKCLVPTPDGPCGTLFYPGDERRYERHVVACAERHDREIQAIVDHNRELSLPDIQDVEFERWVQKWAPEIMEERKKM